MKPPHEDSSSASSSEISDEDTPWSGTPIDTNDPALVAKYESYHRMRAMTKMRQAYHAK